MHSEPSIIEALLRQKEKRVNQLELELAKCLSDVQRLEEKNGAITAKLLEWELTGDTLMLGSSNESSLEHLITEYNLLVELLSYADRFVIDDTTHFAKATYFDDVVRENVSGWMIVNTEDKYLDVEFRWTEPSKKHDKPSNWFLRRTVYNKLSDAISHYRKYLLKEGKHI